MLTVYLLLLILGVLFANFPIASLTVIKSVIPVFSMLGITLFETDGVKNMKEEILEKSGVTLGVRIFGIF